MHKDFEDFLKLLNYHKIKYLIIGGYAVNNYVTARSTKDLDILIEPSIDNGIKILCSLNDFGFVSKLTPKDFVSDKFMIQLVREPIRIDILNYIKGVSLDEVWMNKQKGFFGINKIPVFYIGIKQLIKNKLKVKRKQDLLDVEKLKKIMYGY